MFFSRKASLVRKRSSNGSALYRRLKIEPLENRCLLSVTLSSPSAAAWVYGQTESVSGVVIDGATNAPPPLHTEVDLVNAGAATAAPSPILVKGFTSDASGDVTFDLSAVNVGKYNLLAEFTDSAGNLEKSNTQAVAVSQAATTTALASSADGQSSVPFGRPVVFKATVETVSPGSGIPAGWVTFEDVSKGTPMVLGKAIIAFNTSVTTPDTGVATFVDASLSVGSHSIVAFYAGNRDFMPSDSSAAPDTVVVANAATTTFVSAAPNPAAYGAVVTLSASVLPSFLPSGPTPIPLAGVLPGGAGSTVLILPTGSVQFAYSIHGSTAPTVLLGTVPLIDGEAQLSVPSSTPLIAALPVGIDDIIASYIPDAASKFQGSTSRPYSEVILPAPATIATKTTVTPPSQTVMAGSEAGFTIAVTPATGTAPVPGTDKVYMYDVGAAIGFATVGATVKTFLGLATYDSADSDWTFTTTTPLAAGFHVIEAYFAGDTTFAPSSGTEIVTVVPQLLTHTVVTAAPNPSIYGATVTLTATVLAGNFGPVTTLPAGSIQFAYTPHGTLAPTVLLGSPVPVVNGHAVLQVPSATPAIAPLPVGIDDVIATYIPASSTFTGNTSRPFSEVILPVSGTTPTTTTVKPLSQTIAAGKEASFTISVATPAASPASVTGLVYMFDLGSPILDPGPGGTTGSGPGNAGVAVFLGTASYDNANGDWTFTTMSPLSAGFHSIEAVFAGDSTYASSDGFATVSVIWPPLSAPPIGSILGDPLAPAAIQTGAG